MTLTWIVIILAGATMLLLATLMAYVLGWANKTFHVEVDPRLQAIINELPGANCGGCGFAGCDQYAAAVLSGEAPVNKCPVGGVSCATALAKLLGATLEEHWPHRAVVHCGAHYNDRLKHNEYRGERSCTSANMLSGVQGCTYGCLGMGDCERSCDFDAIHVEDGLATVDYDKCTGCGACAKICPRSIISMVPFKSSQMLVVACCNQDFGKDVKAVCKVGCTGCGLCARASELFKVTDNLARIDYNKYNPAQEAELQMVAAKCPMKKIVFMGEPSEADKAAVADEDAPAEAAAVFSTTVDRTDWHG